MVITEPSGQPDAVPGAGHAGADAAHELANLLTVVLGSLEQLRRQPLDAAGQRQLGRAEWSARQAARLTRQVLSQARGGDGALEVADLNATVSRFAAVMDGGAGGIARLKMEMARDELSARFDAGLLELVLLNLVRNAADAMPAGGEMTLRTRGPRLDGMGGRLTVEVSVSDTGAGMSSAVAGRATEAFFTTKPPGRGTGLGLWMADRFMSACGGKVEIESAPGRGTTVRLVFPHVGGASKDE